MSGSGQTRSSSDVWDRSALPPIATNERTSREVRVVPIGDERHRSELLFDLLLRGRSDVFQRDVMPINAFLLAEHLPNTQLIMYRDASHGPVATRGRLSGARPALSGQLSWTKPADYI